MKNYPRKSACLLNVGLVKNKTQAPRAFTLVELIVVIFIVGILASVVIPILRGKIDSAKWTEANAGAGTIRTVVSTYVARNSLDVARTKFVNKSLDDDDTRTALGFKQTDLNGTYFVAGDYTITEIDDSGHAAVKVESSRDNAPEGEKTLGTDGSWK
jgi:prepilin-type N-terminal cleavage/methylation domain-containing protein